MNLDADEKNLHIEIENTNINLIRVNEICTSTTYSINGYPLPNGTLYRLIHPLQHQPSTSKQPDQVNTSANNLPQFYKEIQKRVRPLFTQSEKLIATLEKSRPQEAAFMQK